MAKGSIFGWVLGALLIGAALAEATLIDNGMTTLDTATGLQWLDVTQTQGQSYDSVIGGFGGFVAAGYRYATTAEICTLYASFGDAVPNCLAGLGLEDRLPASTTDTLIGLIGNTDLAAGLGTYGVYDGGLLASDVVGVSCLQGTGFDNCSTSNATGDTAVFALNAAVMGSSAAGADFGSFLVRQAAAIPEPASALLFGTGLAVLVGLRRRRRGAVS